MIAAIRAGAVGGAAVVAAYAIRAVDAPVVPAVLVVAGAVAVVAGVLGGLGPAVWAGVLLQGTGYVAAVALRGHELDPGAPLVAAILFLVTEAADVTPPRGAAARRLWGSLAVAFATAFLAGALLVAGAAFRTTGAVAAGASAVCGALLLVGLAAFAGERVRP